MGIRNTMRSFDLKMMRKILLIFGVILLVSGVAVNYVVNTNTSFWQGLDYYEYQVYIGPLFILGTSFLLIAGFIRGSKR